MNTSSSNLEIFTKNPKNVSTEEYAMKLFKSLPKGFIQKLYKFFSIDFEMFGYDYLPYYNVGRCGTLCKSKPKNNTYLLNK